MQDEIDEEEETYKIQARDKEINYMRSKTLKVSWYLYSNI